MPTVVTRFVNTASSGGDGTTNETSGATAAYASLSAALADIAADFPDFVSSDVQVDVLCTGAAADTTSVSLPSITTDATRFLRIKANSGQEATLAGWRTDRYRLTTASGAVTLSFGNTGPHHVRLENLQIENAQTASNDTRILVIGINDAASSIIVSACRLRKGGSFSSTSHKGVVFGAANNSNHVLVNCLIEGLTTASCVGVLNQVGAGSAKAYNTLVVGAPTGFSTTVTNNPIAKNCRAANCTDGYNGTFSRSSTNNASDLASDAPGSNPQGSITNAFLDAGAGDYRYASGDGAIDLGADLSGDAVWPFAVDMEATARPQNGTWDIGPFEFVSGGSGGGSQLFSPPSKRWADLGARLATSRANPLGLLSGFAAVAPSGAVLTVTNARVRPAMRALTLPEIARRTPQRQRPDGLQVADPRQFSFTDSGPPPPAGGGITLRRYTRTD